MKRAYKRRLIPVVLKYYQTRLLIFVISYMIIVVMFMAVFVFAPNFMQMTDPHQPFDVQAAAAEKILYGHAAMWPSLAALIAIIGIHFYLVFHRFVGPLYRFSQVFKSIEDGDVSFAVRLRQKDYLTEERDEINRMIGALSRRIGGAQENLVHVRALLEQMAAAETDDNGHARVPSGRMGELREAVARLSENLGYFKTSEDREN